MDWIKTDTAALIMGNCCSDQLLGIDAAAAASSAAAAAAAAGTDAAVVALVLPPLGALGEDGIYTADRP